MSISKKQMTTKKVFIYLGIFLLVLVSLRMLWYSFRIIPEHPQAERGELDLRHWQFSDRQVITLNGEWEFYPGQFVSPAASGEQRDELDRLYMQVPGKWSSSINQKFGYGTYRLRVLIQDTDGVYSIQLPNVQSASRLYINGQMYDEMGHPAETKEHNKARNVPYSVNFHTAKSEVEVLLHVSNFHIYGMGGIVQSVKFGTATAMMNERLLSEMLQIVVCVVLLLHGIYAGILFGLGHRGKELLYFALMIFFAVLSVLTDDDKLLLVWLPMPMAWVFKLKIIIYICLAIFLMLCTKSLLGRKENRRTVRALLVFSAAGMLLMIVLPDRYLRVGNHLLLIIMLAVIILVPYFAFRSIREGEKSAVFVLMAAAAVSLNIFIGGIIKSRFWADMPYYPLDLIIAFVSFAAFWFIRFAQTTFHAKRLAERLQEEDKRKDEFLANTSHELRNPLHGMINMAQAVLDNGQNRLIDRHRSDLKLLIQIGQRLSLQLNDLLDVSLLREGQIRLDKQSVSVQATASGVVEMLRYLSDAKKLEMVLDVPDAFPRVLADENRLVQILFNLLHNAIKYTNEGFIVLSAEVHENEARIYVRDTGIGMDEETQRRVFLPYHQGTSNSPAIQGGLGLGLSICKQFVELHGSSLELQSVPGQGSVFSFSLPLAVADQDQAAPEQGESGEDDAAYLFLTSADRLAEPAVAEESTPEQETVQWNSQPKIIAVDDDPVNLKILQHILSQEHYHISAVTTAEEALQLLDSGEWDLVISDVMMPNISGYELTREIRRKYTISELPILLLTARSRSQDIEAGFKAGANDYLSKPMDALELKTRVQALIALKRSIMERLHMEAAWLQAQIQPHFLYNTLNSVASLSVMDTSRMVVLLERFGSYLRTSFDVRNLQRLVPIEHELEMLHSYLYIEKERFGDRLQVVWDLQDYSSVQIPPLSVQPIVENSVRHGLLTRVSGGTVTIRIHNHPDYTEIIVEDDGVGIEEEKLRCLLETDAHSRRGIGLINTDRRLKQLYGQGLHISSVPGEGTRVAFQIPKPKS